MGKKSKVVPRLVAHPGSRVRDHAFREDQRATLETKIMQENSGEELKAAAFAKAHPTSPIAIEFLTGRTAKKLETFVLGRLKGILAHVDDWVDVAFDGDMGKLEAEAKREQQGKEEAQLAFGLLTVTAHTFPIDGIRPYTYWLQKAASGGYAEAKLGYALINTYHLVRVPGGVVEKRIQDLALKEASKVKRELHYLSMRGMIYEDVRILVDGGDHKNSIAANYVSGMLDCLFYGSIRSKADMLVTARRFRLAAHDGLMEAEWELGEIFRQGLGCDVHRRFARKYIRRASQQGHAEAIERMKELRRCACCGAEDAPLKCSRCLESRYCSSTCSSNHWVQGKGELNEPHKLTCSRRYSR